MSWWRMICYGILVTELTMLATARLGAQESTDSLHQRCDRAVAAVETGLRDVPGAYATIYECGRRGEAAVARSWGVWKRVTDRDALVRFATTTRFIRGDAVFDALMDVAADESATPLARALALRNLRTMREPASVLSLKNLETLAGALTQPNGIQNADTFALCGSGMLTADAPTDQGRPITQGQLQRMTALAATLVRLPAVPPLVRAAAMCS